MKWNTKRTSEVKLRLKIPWSSVFGLEAKTSNQACKKQVNFFFFSRGFTFSLYCAAYGRFTPGRVPSFGVGSPLLNMHPFSAGGFIRIPTRNTDIYNNVKYEENLTRQTQIFTIYLEKVAHIGHENGKSKR